MHELFRRFAEKTSEIVGSAPAFVAAVAIIIAWAVLGPVFGYSDTWQLVINTGTTIITFLIVFLIQNSQNREMRVIRLKLDELLRGTEGARTDFVSLDHMNDKELDAVQKEFEKLEKKYPHLIRDDLHSIREERLARHNKKGNTEKI
jgi:low affinity Fe/Cu permease